MTTSTPPRPDQEAAREQLAQEVINAFQTGAHTLVQTPGFCETQSQLVLVVDDHMTGRTGDEDYTEMLALVAALSKQESPLGIRAKALIHKIAWTHADFHADDLLASQEGW